MVHRLNSWIDEHIFLCLANPLDIGLTLSSGVGLQEAIPIRRTTYVHYGPPTVIVGPAASLPGVIATDPVWNMGAISNYGYGF